MLMSDITELSVCELIGLLKKKELSSLEITRAYLDNIARFDNELHAYITVTAEKAIAAAAKADKLLASDKAPSVFCGIPIAYKDNICTEGVRTTCASKMLTDFTPVYSADVVKTLESAGTVMLGKLNMDEFAMGSTTESSAFFSTLNPVDTTRVPGGSSGGSAAAVAGKLAPCALGSDTGGSIRQPSAFCGAVGIKPTYGRVSRYGLIPLASSLDQIGVITRTVKDNALLLDFLSAPTDNDATYVGVHGESGMTDGIDGSIKGMKIGVPRELSDFDIEDAVKNNTAKAIRAYEELGADIVEISIPSIKHACTTYSVIVSAEASENLERFDGVRFGKRDSAPCSDISELYKRSRSSGFGFEVKRRIMLGTFALDGDFKAECYDRAVATRQLITSELKNALEKCDVILTPTTPRTAYKLGENTVNSRKTPSDDIFVIPASLAGLPALSLPSGKDDIGLSTGVQIIGKSFSERELYRCAFALEKALG